MDPGSTSTHPQTFASSAPKSSTIGSSKLAPPIPTTLLSPNKACQLSKATLPAVSTTPSTAIRLEKEQDASKLRAKAYIAQTLLLFNILGVPLSFSPWLEYYYNSYLPGTLLYQLSLIPAVQLLLIFGLAFPVGWLYDCGYFRRILASAIALAIACPFLLTFCTKWWHVLLCQGIELGVSHGSLYALGTLALASHYKNNISLVSGVGIAVGFTGGILYTLVATFMLQDGRFVQTCIVNGCISISTLVPVYFLLRPNEAYRRLPAQYSRGMRRDRGTWWFVLGFLCTFFSLFIGPTYLVLYVSASQIWPLAASSILLISLTLGFASSLACSWFKVHERWGSVNLFIIATLLAGSCYIPLVWLRDCRVIWVCSSIYGLCLGVLLGYYGRVVGIFLGGLKPVSHVRVRKMLTLSSLACVAGETVTSLLIKVGGGNFELAFVVCGVVMVLGGLLLLWARMVKIGWRWYVII